MKPTDEFEYLAVLLSIVLGLGVAQLLTGAGRLIHARQRVEPYWPTFVWVALLLLIHVQTWWAMFELRGHQPWSFEKFLVVLMSPVSLYLMTAIILPDPSEHPPGGRLDLRAHFYAQTRWFFGATAAAILASLARPMVLDGRLEPGLDLGFQLLFLALAIVGALTRNRRFHESLAAVSVVLFTTYVVVLFVRLR